MTPKIKLTYFDMKGRAESIRLALVVGGVEFEDERIDGAEFMERKTSGKLTFGSLPVMEVDGEMFCESGAMLRYAAKIGGFTPTCPVNACRVDMVIEAIDSLVFAAKKGNTSEGYAKFVEDDLPRYLGPIELLFAKSEGLFLLGNDISIADIKMAVTVDIFRSGFLEHIPTDCTDKFTAISELYTSVMEQDKIKKYYASQ